VQLCDGRYKSRRWYRSPVRSARSINHPGSPVTKQLYYQVNFVLAAAYSQISQLFLLTQSNLIKRHPHTYRDLAAQPNPGGHRTRAQGVESRAWVRSECRPNKFPHHQSPFNRNKFTLKSTIFWDITPCSPLKANRRFVATYRLHLQGRRIRRTRNHRENRWQAQGYIPEDSTLHNHCCKNLKSYMFIMSLLLDVCNLPMWAVLPTFRRYMLAHSSESASRVSE
jgi:hypothetical protein